MDMLLLFMLFSTVTPFLLWSRRRALALTHLVLAAGMWGYFLLRFFHTQAAEPIQILLVVLFFANLVFTEFALIRFCIDFGKDLQQRSEERASGRWSVETNRS